MKLKKLLALGAMALAARRRPARACTGAGLSERPGQDDRAVPTG